MSNRGLWKFPYLADKLLAASIVKQDYHKDRLKWWLDKQDEIKEKIKSEGIEIDESLAVDFVKDRTGSASNNFSNYRGPVASIRNDLLNDLGECVSKSNEHRGKMRDYNAWEQVLSSQGSASFDLYQDDWLFFFGK